MIAVLLAFAMQAGAASDAPAPLAALLQAKDQALLDAVATGDRATWQRTLTNDAVYVDENGRILTKAELIAELNPLPAGITGQIRIVDYKVRLIGKTALVVHRDEEQEMFHGQPLTATYLTSATWVQQNGDWRLALVHVHVMESDPPPITVSTDRLKEYVGRYQAAPDLIWVIRVDGDHLAGSREGRPPQPLQVEVSDVLFVPGQPRARKIFQRDDRGQITGFVDRRDGHDIRWTRMP